MFTLWLIVKLSVAKRLSDRTSVHIENISSGTVFAPEQDCSALLLKVECLYRISFWNRPELVWPLLSEQKLQQNLPLVDGELYKQLWTTGIWKGNCDALQMKPVHCFEMEQFWNGTIFATQRYPGEIHSSHTALYVYEMFRFKKQSLCVYRKDKWRDIFFCGMYILII